MNNSQNSMEGVINPKKPNNFKNMLIIIIAIIIIAVVVFVGLKLISNKESDNKQPEKTKAEETISKYKKNTFKIESIQVAMAMIDFFNLNSATGENKITSLAGYEYNCLTVAQLQKEGYIEFSENNKYIGFIQVWKINNEEVVKITITDGVALSYNNKLLSEIQNDKENALVAEDILAEVDMNCPTDNNP